MFDRYIPLPFENYRPLISPDTPLPPPIGSSIQKQLDSRGIRELLSRFSLSDLNSGDILLLGLLVFLLNRKADEELLIAMGLLLIM